MAQVPYNQGVPTVEPALTPPSDYEQIQPTGFEAVQKMGEQAQQTGRYLSQIFGQIAANDAFNGFQKQASDLMFGTPGKTVGVDQDGKPIPDTGFMGLRGRAALDAWPGFSKSLEDLRTKSRAGLTLESANQFDSDSRRFISNARDRAGGFIDQQTKEYYDSVNKGTLTNSLDGISKDPLNETTFQHSMADAQNALVKNAEIGGAAKGDPVWKAAFADGAKLAWAARIKAIGATDPDTALALVEKNRGLLGEQYAILHNELRERASTQEAQGAVTKAISDQKAGVPSPPPAATAPVPSAAPATAAPPAAPAAARSTYPAAELPPAAHKPWRTLSPDVQDLLKSQGFTAPTDTSKPAVPPVHKTRGLTEAAPAEPSAPKPLPAVPEGAGAEIAKTSLGTNVEAAKKAWNDALGNMMVAGGLQSYFDKLPMDLKIATARNFAAHPEMFQAVPERYGVFAIREPLRQAQIKLLKSLPPEPAAPAPGTPRSGPPLEDRTIGAMKSADSTKNTAPTSEMKAGAFGVTHDPANLGFLNARRAGGAAASANSIAGMRPELQDRLAALFRMAPAQWQAGLRIVSGYRDWLQQAHIHAADIAKGTPWMSAHAGGSYHEGRGQGGEAADIGWGDNARLGAFPPGLVDWLHQNANKVGLKFPLSFENWHVELMETDGGRVTRGGPVYRGPMAGLAPLPAQSTGEVSKEVWKSNDGNARAVDAMNYFMKSNGDTRLMAAARAGAMIGESGMDPTILGPSGDYGLIQVMGPRKARLLAIANHADPYVQMDFSNTELKGPEAKAYEELRAARDPREATIAMLDYERPGWWLAANRDPRVAERNPSFRRRLAATAALMEGKSLGNMVVAGGTNVQHGGIDYRLTGGAGGGAPGAPVSMAGAAQPGSPTPMSISQAAASLFSVPQPSPAATKPPTPAPTGTAAPTASATDTSATEAQPPPPEPIIPIGAATEAATEETPPLLDRKQDLFDRIKAMHLPFEAEQKALELAAKQANMDEIAAGATERQRKLVNDQAADKYTQAIAQGAITPQLLHQIDTDPHLTDFHTRMALHEWAMKDPESWDAMALRGGPGFAKAWSDIIAPSGEPDRITDKSALYRLAQDQKLSPWGLAYLSKMADDVRKDPDRQALNEQIASLFHAAKDYLTFDQSDQQDLPAGVPRLKDPHGVELYEKFVWQFLHGLDAWEKGVGGRGGKDPHDYVTPENAEKMYKNMRSPREMALAKLQAAEQLVPANVRLPPAPQGVDEHGWHEIMSVPVTFAGQELTLQKWSNMVGALAASPTPHHKDLFDKYVGDSFAKVGLDPKTKPSDLILEVLGVKEAPQTSLVHPVSKPGKGEPEQTGAKSVLVEQPKIFNPVTEVIEHIRKADADRAAGTIAPAPELPPPGDYASSMREHVYRLYLDTLLKKGMTQKKAEDEAAKYMQQFGGPPASH